MTSSYPDYRYPHSVHPPSSRAGLTTLLPPLLPSEPSDVSQSRRGHCTMAMLLGDDRGTAVDARCRYPSKLCRHTRVRKASGALHRYCAYHRNKANANQKRWIDRQRSEASPSGSESSLSPPASPSEQARAKFRWILAAAGSTPLSREDSSGDPARGSDAPRAEERHENEENEDENEDEDPRASAATLGDEDWDALLSLLVPSDGKTDNPGKRARESGAGTAQSYDYTHKTRRESGELTTRAKARVAYSYFDDIKLPACEERAE